MLAALQQHFSLIREVRGRGLLVGMELDRNGKRVVTLCQERGLLVNCTADKVIRFMPPLTITRSEVDEAVAILRGVLQQFAGEPV
jgi:acetylornithine/succinyldiaminopimelate/putrescine aminotransferase